MPGAVPPAPRPPAAWRIFKGLLLLGLVTFGCCGGVVSLCTAALSGAGGGLWLEPGWRVRTGQLVELGIAAFPKSARSPWRDYTWAPSAAADPHHLRYILGSPEAHALAERYRAFAENVVAPCTDLLCAYEFIYRSSEAAIDPIAERFIERIRAAGLKADDAARLVISFVQQIPYAIPKDQPFEVLPAPLVVAEGRGDCDSKAVLGVMLLRRLGIPAVLLVSEPLAHAAVGVGLPGPGLAISYRGRPYLYAEVTSKGWPIGEAAPDVNKPRLWRAVWVGPRE
ncbi:MAG: transglutaminase domain-containing protein [Myxococcaceae bacterium]|nr:transglutaminase domain-containing protein [Myxococcaceae bacterium]